VPGQLVKLHERAGVEEHLDPFAGGLLAACVLLLDRASRPGVDRLVDPPFQVRQLAGRRVDVDLGGALLPSHDWIVTTLAPEPVGRPTRRTGRCAAIAGSLDSHVGSRSAVQILGPRAGAILPEGRERPG
jgi:hypothetical protein